MEEVSTFSILPPELKCLILSELTPKARQKLREVEKSMNEIILWRYGLTLKFTNRNWNAVLYTTAPASALNAIFRDFTYPMIRGLEGKDLAMRLNSLTFEGLIVCYNLAPLLQETQNLSKLEFGKITLSPNLAPDAIDTIMDHSRLLPLLKTLIVTLHFESPAKWHEYKVMLLALIPFFTGNKLLKFHLNYDVPIHLLFTVAMFQEGFTLPTDQGLRMQEDDTFLAQVIAGNRLTLEEWTVIHKQYLSTSVLTIYPVADANGVQQMRSDGAIAKEFYYSRYLPQRWGEFDWLGWLGTQTKLTTLTLIGFHGKWELVCHLLMSNRRTLKIVRLANDVVDQQPPSLPTFVFDAYAFSRLQVLEKLTFLNQTRTFPEIWSSRLSELLNIRLFPSTIQTLNLSITIAFKNRDEFCSEAFENLKNLELFEFSAYPWFCFRDSSSDPVTVVKFLDTGMIRNLINWLPKLCRLKLWNRNLDESEEARQVRDTGVVPARTRKSQDSLPFSTIGWIDTRKGITFKKIPVQANARGVWDYLMDIQIPPSYRENAASS